MSRARGTGYLVDVGHDDESSNRVLSERYDVIDWQPPEVVLAKVGVAPEDIDTVILSHLHYDHAPARRGAFPNATFYLQRQELEGSRWALANAHLFQSIIGAIDPSDVEMLGALADTGRLVLLDGDLDLFPGVQIRAARDTHTPGSQFVVVDNGGQNWVVTGDNMYSYRERRGRQSRRCSGQHRLRRGQLLEQPLHDRRDAPDRGSTDRLVIAHEGETFVRHPSRTFDDHLAVAELTLATGTATRI